MRKALLESGGDRIKIYSLPAIAKVVGLEDAEGLDHFLTEAPWSVEELKKRRLRLILNLLNDEYKKSQKLEEKSSKNWSKEATLDLANPAKEEMKKHPWWNEGKGWKNILNNLRLFIQPLGTLGESLTEAKPYISFRVSFQAIAN